MWLAKPVYEGLPYCYAAAGLAALAGAFWARSGHWPAILTGAGFTLLVAGLALWLKRRGYRSSRSRLDFEETR